MTKIYNYHPDTGEYLGQSTADIDPLGGGVLIPAFATDNAPPQTGVDEIAVFDAGKWTKQQTPVAPVPTPKQLRAAKLVEINAHASALLSQACVDIPPEEVSTWSKQEAEARALLADKEATAPFVRNLAASRHVPLDTLVGKIIEKADAYAEGCGQVVGTRQRLEDQLNAIDLNANDAAKQIEAIKWPK